MSDAEPVSVDLRRSLLRLYLSWPIRVDAGTNEEAIAFYEWLSQELTPDELEDLAGSQEDVTAFIQTFDRVLGRARYLKGWREATEEDAREDARSAIHTQVFFVVYDCVANPAMEGEIVRGIVLDTAKSGMRVETHLEVPAGSILAMTVVSTGQQMSPYHLTGEVRWHNELAESHHVGVSIFSVESYKRWQDFHTANAKLQREE